MQTTSAQVSGTVEKQQIDELPILDRRAIALLGLQAGVAGTGPSAFMPTTINGQRTSFSTMTLDGINIQDNFIRDNALDFTPNLPFNSQAQEFTVITQNADVDKGGGASQVSIVTPKGTNQFHGEGFWYYRSNAWAANNWFNDASGIPKPDLLQNQGGGNIGGPIIKNKLFVYGYYEMLRLRTQLTSETTVLSPTILSAISSGSPTLPFTYQPVDNTTGNPSGPPQTVNLFNVSNLASGGAVPVFTPDRGDAGTAGANAQDPEQYAHGRRHEFVGVPVQCAQQQYIGQLRVPARLRPECSQQFYRNVFLESADHGPAGHCLEFRHHSADPKQRFHTFPIRGVELESAERFHERGAVRL